METKAAKPFLKWAGGKTQLLQHIKTMLPAQTGKAKFTYVEPFAGSGAVLFWMLSNFPALEKAVINDINADLVNVYQTIAARPRPLIKKLAVLQAEFHALENDAEAKREYYNAKRALYNTRRQPKTGQAALFIFLNRTCFNGLYRVNRNNEFNVPMGRYKKPTICDTENILAVSKALQKVEILCGDYQQTLKHAGKNAFFYFDPPYKPLSTTSNFNAYAKFEFNDAEQVRLRDFCARLDKLGHAWMLSNSDVKDTKQASFFDDLYSDFNIKRVKARRNINSKSAKRGQLNELLVTNYNT